MAPPLDGIWITAPYLHNGSVPTLEALLNSSLRPRYWSRNFKKKEYDYEKIGWKHTVHETGGKASTTPISGATGLTAITLATSSPTASAARCWST
jgi:cytochrome c peroxidase